MDRDEEESDHNFPNLEIRFFDDARQEWFCRSLSLHPV